ncbi:MAG: kynureninase [Acidimicrobiales bacterium]
MPVAPTREDALALDGADPLAACRGDFVIHDGAPIYLDGNSLGRPPAATVAAVSQALAEWGRRLVGGWEDWIDLPAAVGDRVGALIGAAPGQVLVCDSTTVNLYKLAAGALASLPQRTTIVADANDFPTDRYVLAGLAEATGRQLRLVPGDAVEGLDLDALDGALDETVALLCLSHVNYRSAARSDMASVTSIAHEVGALVCWDLCHSAGALPVQLDSDGVDLAVGCTYKYLNAGPGAPAFAYVSRALQGQLRQPIWGWFSQADQFEMGPEYRAASGVARYQTGTPPVLGLVAVDSSAAHLAGVGIDRLWAKSEMLTALMVDLVATRLAGSGVSLASPADPSRRGAHVSLAHPSARELCETLISSGKVVGDFRTPDVLRLGPAPAYTRFVDVWDAFDAIADALSTRCPSSP